MNTPHADDTVFVTDRTLVRDWRDSDADWVFDTYSRWEVAKWLGREPRALEKPEEAAAVIERWRAGNNGDETGGIWAVERKDDGVLAGTVLLVPLPGGDGEYEVGWHFHPDSWGHGYASESARGVLSLGWERGLTEVFAVVRPGNDASIAVCRRIGMKQLGLTTKYYDSELALFQVEP